MSAVPSPHIHAPKSKIAISISRKERDRSVGSPKAHRIPIVAEEGTGEREENSEASQRRIPTVACSPARLLSPSSPLRTPPSSTHHQPEFIGLDDFVLEISGGEFDDMVLGRVESSTGGDELDRQQRGDDGHQQQRAAHDDAEREGKGEGGEG